MAKMAVQLWRVGNNSLMKALVGKLIFQKKYSLALERPGITVEIKKELRDNER